MNRLDAEPLVVPVSTASGETVEVTIDGYKLANAVLLLLAGGPAASADLPRMIHEIAAGDGAAGAATIRSFVPPSGFVGLGLQWGVFCRESIPQTSLDEVVTTGRQALPDFPEGVLRLLPQVPRFFDDCAIWDVGVADAQAREAVVSNVPVLIMGGTFDAVTAPSWQDALSPGLNASQVVNFPCTGTSGVLAIGMPGRGDARVRGRTERAGRSVLRRRDGCARVHRAVIASPPALRPNADLHEVRRSHRHEVSGIGAGVDGCRGIRVRRASLARRVATSSRTRSAVTSPLGIRTASLARPQMPR